MAAGGAAGAAGASGAAAAAAIAQAIKASGVIVHVEPGDFLFLVEQNDQPLVVHATGGFFSRNDQYLTSYRGLAFYAKSKTPLTLPGHCEVIESKKIWIPG